MPSVPVGIGERADAERADAERADAERAESMRRWGSAAEVQMAERARWRW